MEGGGRAGGRESEESLMSRFDLVAFDCDGVLVDSEPITNRALTEVLNEIGWRISFEETMQTFIGRSVRDHFAVIEKGIGKPVPAHFYQEFVTRRDRMLEAGITAIRGVHEVVEQLSQRDLPFCVASGADRAKMRLTLGKTGLLPLFEGRMFSGMEVARTKPAPDVYLLAARTMQADPSRCVVIEDTPTGVAAGVAAGMTVYGYAACADPQRLREAGAAQVFDDMAALPEMLW
jgi:HAD superfamily hydrolase (TIGR01509 family)